MIIRNIRRWRSRRRCNSCRYILNMMTPCSECKFMFRDSRWEKRLRGKSRSDLVRKKVKRHGKKTKTL